MLASKPCSEATYGDYFFAKILTLPDRKEKIIFVGRFEILSGR